MNEEKGSRLACEFLKPYWELADKKIAKLRKQFKNIDCVINSIGGGVVLLATPYYLLPELASLKRELAEHIVKYHYDGCCNYSSVNNNPHIVNQPQIEVIEACLDLWK